MNYKYNGDNLLTERTENGITTRYYYDGDQMIAEGVVTNGVAAHKASYLRGNQLVARVDATGSKAYYVHNGHGDVVELRDANGNVINQYAYDLWGNPTTILKGVDNPFLYSGEYWDESVKLQYLRARWYDPSMGRFINEDTYEGQLDNPLSLNLYTYVLNNPLKYTDPSGHCVAGVDSGCYVDSASGLDDQLIDAVRTEVMKSSSLWSDLQQYKQSCKSTSCVENVQAKQKMLEHANDKWRNNACSYSDCSIGVASFILNGAIAVGVKLKVALPEESEGILDSIIDFVSPKAYAADLPDKSIGEKTRYGYIEHYYRSGDHGPPHVHVIDGDGNVVRVGQNGKPLDGEPKLNKDQARMVEMYRGQIRSSVGRIMRWYRSNNPDKYKP